MGGSFGVPETLNGYVNVGLNGDLNGWLLGGRFGAGLGGLSELHFRLQFGTKIGHETDSQMLLLSVLFVDMLREVGF